MTSRTKLWALSAGALALSLALAGCGGGGSSSSSGSQPMGPATTPMPAMAMVSLDMVTTTGTGYMAPEAGTIEIVADMSETSGSVTFMCEAGDEDCTVMVADDGTVTSTGGMVTAMNSDAFQMALDAAAEAARVAAAAMVAARTAAAVTKETAIAAEADQTDDASLGGDGVTIGNGDGDYELVVKRDNAGTTITVTVHGATDADDETFMKAADLPGSVEGHVGQMHTRTMEADMDGNVMTEVAVVYTDIQAPMPVAFAAFESSDGMKPQELNLSTDTTNDDPTETNEALTVATTDAVRMLVSSPSFASGPGASTTHTFDFDDTITENMDEAEEVAGTYNGADGTYRCNGSSDCTVTVNSDGMITALSDGWIFTPDADAMSDQPDYDHLRYGFWLKRTADKDGATTYNEVETFAYSSIAATGAVNTVEGIANYKGGAAGVYVIRSEYDSGTGDLIDANSGHFSADASLTAYFAGGNTPANMNDTLTGTIDNFMLSGGEENSWSVTLQSDANLDEEGIQPSTDGTHSGTASGGVMGEAGSFNATFHGPIEAVEGVVPQPHTVIGEFNSVFSNGSVAGAFGARKEDN